MKDLVVTFTVNWDLITQGDTGFSLQLNCYPQTNPQAVYQKTGAPWGWLQFVIAVQADEVQAGIQYWAQQPKYKGEGFSLARITISSHLHHQIVYRGER